MKIYHIKGFGTDSICKEFKPNIKTMGLVLAGLGVSITTFHELTNTLYLIDLLGRSDSGKLILQNKELTDLLLNSPLIQEWIKNPNMIAEFQNNIAQILQSAFAGFGF